MKLLFENWRKYQMMERINELDSGKRFILDRLVEVTEEDNKTGLPEDQLEKIKKWAGLSGEANFLGRGSRGSAFKFGDKVLKITNDINEAKGAALIMGKNHPNVYTIEKVGKRSQEDIDNSNIPGRFVIVYEFLDYPNTMMTDATNQMLYKVKSKDKGNRYYQWKPEYLNLARRLTKDLSVAIADNPQLLGEPQKKYGPPIEKIEKIADELQWSIEEQMIFSEFWALDYGVNNRRSLDTPENLNEYGQNIFNNPIAEYFHQLALGLTFLYNNGVVFRDLKGPNVMEKDGQIVIIDIGYSNIKGDPELSLIG